MRTLKLYGTGSATGNNIAQIIIPSAGRLRGIQCAISADSITDNAQLSLEVSRSSATEIAINGSQQCVAQIEARQNFVTSGLAPIGINAFFPLDIPVVQGQIIYLHAVIVGTITYYATFLIQYE